MTFPIYAIERDNGTGSYLLRHSFAPLGQPTVSHAHSTGRVDYQDTDAGLVATISAPEGSTLAEGNAGDLGLLLPGESSVISADEALAGARGPASRSYGLSIVDA